MINTKHYPQNVQRLVAAVLAQEGDTPTNLREEIMSHATALSVSQQSAASPPAAWHPYIDTVIKHAYRVTDKHTEQLQTLGHGEDEIFELTIAAALGAGLARLERGLAVLNETDPNEAPLNEAPRHETATN